MEAKRPGTFKHFIIILLVITAVFATLYTVKFPITPSIDKSLLIRDYTNKKLERHDYALFELNHELIGGKHNVIKIIGCMEFDKLELKDGKYYCNNALITEVRLTRDSGEPLPQFNYTGIIPEGKAFVYGKGEYSFGSRHWGFIDLNSTARLIAIF